MPNTEIDILKIQEDVGLNIFSLKNEQYNWNNNMKYKELPFSDFLLMLDDFYLFAYGGSLKRSTWQVFGWLRYLTRSDGIARISYTDIIRMFCRDGEKMSSPTFYKCIEELCELNLIVKIRTRKEFDGKEQNGENAYAIISKTDIVYNMCDVYFSEQISPYDCYLKVTNKEVKEKTVKPQPVNSKDSQSKVPDKKRVSLLMLSTFKPIKSTIEKFFTFLGSFNTSKNVSVGRKIDFLLTVKEQYLTIGFDLNDVQFAINKTMANTANSGNKNYKREKYFYAILNSQIEYVDEVVPENEVADELSKEASDKVRNTYFNNSSNLTESDYKSHIHKLSKIKNYHLTLIKDFSDDVSELGSKLYKLAKLIDNKHKDIMAHKKYSTNRIKYLLENGIVELVEYDSKWNRLIEWSYEDDEDNKVPFDVILGLYKKNPKVFVFSKYELFEGKESIK